jgi:hypothetical protein
MGKTKRKSHRRSAAKQNARQINRGVRVDPPRLEAAQPAPRAETSGFDQPRLAQPHPSADPSPSGRKPATTVALIAAVLAGGFFFAQALAWRSGLSQAENAKQAAEIVASTAQAKADTALAQVATLEQAIAGLKTQLADKQAEIADKQRQVTDQQAELDQQETLIAEHKLHEQQKATLLDQASTGTKIEPGEAVAAGKPATIKGDLVTPDQQPARFVTVDAWRADTRIATTVSDKNGRFSLQLPGGDDVVLKFQSPGRITGDVPLTGKQNYQLKVLLAERDGEQVRR